MALAVSMILSIVCRSSSGLGEAERDTHCPEVFPSSLGSPPPASEPEFFFLSDTHRAQHGGAESRSGHMVALNWVWTPKTTSQWGQLWGTLAFRALALTWSARNPVDYIPMESSGGILGSGVPLKRANCQGPGRTELPPTSAISLQGQDSPGCLPAWGETQSWGQSSHGALSLAWRHWAGLGEAAQRLEDLKPHNLVQGVERKHLQCQPPGLSSTGHNSGPRRHWPVTPDGTRLLQPGKCWTKPSSSRQSGCGLSFSRNKMCFIFYPPFLLLNFD